jgi:hypothetical protein
MLTIAILVALALFLLRKSTVLPGMALVGLFCMYTVEQWAQSQSIMFVQRSAIINVLFAGVAAYALALRIYRRELRGEPYPLAAVLVIVLYSYALLSTSWSSAFDWELKEIWTKFAPYIFVQLLIAPLLVANAKDLTRIFSNQIFVGGLFCTLIVFMADYIGRKIILGDDPSISGNPLAVAETGGITIICAVMMTRMFKWDILVKLVIAGFCMVAIIKSGSRGQLIALAFALVVAFPFTYSIKNPKIIVSSAIVAVILAYVVIVGLEAFWGGTTGRYSTEAMSGAYSIRLDRTSRLFDAWISNPAAIVFGLGNSASYDWDIIGHYPHIVPMEILCEEGLLGATLYVWILMIVARDALYVLRMKDPGRKESPGLAILIGIITYLFLLSFKQGSMLSTSSFFMIIMLFTRAVAYRRRLDQQEQQESEAPAQTSKSRDYTIYARNFQSQSH